MVLSLAAARPAFAEDRGGPLRLVPQFLEKGFKLIPKRLREFQFPLGFSPVTIKLAPTVNFGSDRHASERNKLLQAQLNEVRRIHKQLKLQTDTLDRFLLAMQGEKLLRKDKYEFKGDKLIVIVADFSSGGSEGREIADEIANHLRTLQKLGIEMDVLVGEVRSGFLIRNEHMARDIGSYLPPAANYAVIWGTLSPKTVGHYRPHITFVQRSSSYDVSGKSHDAGIAHDFSLELESKELPLPTDDANYRRQCFERLIGVTCAAVPACYALHEISRDRTPQLAKLYEFLGPQSEASKQLKQQMDRFTYWTETRRSAGKQHLRSLSQFGHRASLPRTILNIRDGSVMTLITDSKGKEIRFADKQTGKPYVAYMDVLETTNRQFVGFLNDRKPPDKELNVWIKFDPNGNTVFDDIDRKGKTFDVEKPSYADTPVINVSWFGARAYCEWAGKELPNKQEWQAAAAFDPSQIEMHPSGTGFGPQSCNSADARDGQKYYCTGGTFPRDRSRIGCFDMAGNVAEWLADPVTHDLRPVAGGSWLDHDFKYFKNTGLREQNPGIPRRWIGFRGIVRIPVDAAK
jgi:hypothetical protein